MPNYFKRIRDILFNKSYTRFFIVGITGLLFLLFLTWFFTRFVFGLDQYVYGYSIGLAATLVLNFLLHTFYTFKSKGYHKTRFLSFSLHYVLMIFIQATLVTYITPRVGLGYYLIVIATVVFVLSNLNFLFFKYILFKTPNEKFF